MMAVSDNAATDVIIARVGLERINATLRELGLERTVLAGDCADIGQAIMDAVGASSPDDLPPLEDPEVRRRLLTCRALDPEVATTPRELTALLAMIWRGEAGLPACERGRMADGPAVSAMPAWPGRSRFRPGWGPRAAACPRMWSTRPGWSTTWTGDASPWRCSPGESQWASSRRPASPEARLAA
jgi:hypothetical protein